MPIDQAAATLPTAPPVTVTASAPIKAFSEDDGPSFKDVLDILNPLQHIPIINTIYRHLTGDEEGAVADVGGGALWAGPIGLIGSMVDLAVRSESGKSIGDNILSWLGLDDDDAPAEAAEAQTQQQAQQQQAQQAAAAPLPALAAQTLAPPPARPRGDDRKDGRDAGKDAPAKIGEYMVFGATAAASAGGSAGGQPVSLTPVAESADRDASRGPGRQGSYLVFGSSAAAVSVADVAPAESAGIGRQGDYMVFGVSVPTAAGPAQLAQATPAAAASAYAAPMAPIPAAPTQAAAAPVPPGGGPAPLTPLPARTFAAPARRAQVTPDTLPMPTTGPAAIPGRGTPSQALPAISQADASWFANAVNAGLDKYAAAQKLSDQAVTANADAAASAQASAESFATIH